MITPQFHIPEGELSSELLQLIPPDDTILYTSAVAVRKCGFASALKFGQLAITNRGLAFTAKRRGLTGGIMALRGGPILQYVSFDRVEIIKNLGRMVRIRVTPHPSEADSKAVEYELIVERSKPHEDSSTFKERREAFGAFLEQAIYLYRTGQAVPPPVPPRAAQIPSAVPVHSSAPPTVGSSTQPRRPLYCPQCGAFLEDPGRFCDQCGASLDEE